REEGFPGAVRPEDLDGVYPADRSQAEMGAGVAAAQITLARVDPARPAAPAGPNRDLRAVGVAPALGRQGGPADQPAASRACPGAVEAGPAGDVGDQQVHGPSVKAAPGQAAPHPGGSAERVARRGNVAEAAAALVGEQLVALGVQAPEGLGCRLPGGGPP